MFLIMFWSKRLRLVNIFISDSNRHIKNSFIGNLWLTQSIERLINPMELSAGLGTGWDLSGD